MKKLSIKNIILYILPFLMISILVYLYFYYRQMPGTFIQKKEIKPHSRIYQNDEIYKQALNFYNNNNFRNSLYLLEKIINNERKIEQQDKIYLLQGLCYKKMGRTDLAFNAFQKSVSIKKQAMTYFLMGSLFEQEQKIDQALKYYEAAYVIDSENYLVTEHLAKLYFFYADYQKASDFYKLILKSRTYNKKIKEQNLLRLAILEYLNNHVDQALKNISKYIKTAENREFISEAYLFLALNYLRKNDIENAEFNFKKGLVLNEKTSVFNILFSTILIKKENYKEAIAILEQFSEDSPYKFLVNKLLGEIYIISQRYKEGAKFFSKIPNIETSKLSLYNFALCLYEISEIEASREQLLKVIRFNQLDDYEYSAYLLLNDCLQRLEMYNSAITINNNIADKFGKQKENIYNKAFLLYHYFKEEEYFNYIEKFIDNPDYYIEFADFSIDYYIKKRDYQKAQTIIIELLQIRDDNPLYYKFAGDIFLLLDDYQNSLKYYQKSISLSDKNLAAIIYNNIGYLYYYNRSMQKAIDNFEKGMGVNPGPMLFYNLSLCYKELNNSRQYQYFTEKALKSINESNDPKLQSLIYYETGEVMFRNNQYTEAKEYYTLALEKDPFNIDAEYRLKF